MVIEFSCKSKVTIKGGLLQMEPALIFSDPQKSFIGQQYNFLMNCCTVHYFQHLTNLSTTIEGDAGWHPPLTPRWRGCYGVVSFKPWLALSSMCL